MVDGYFDAAAGPSGNDATPLRRGNFAARMRMAVLYDRSVTFGGLVVGTGNKTESLIGYTTLFGDSACAFNPIGDLYKSQVRQLAVALGVPDAIVRKAPSADLWPGQTDETEGGFSYPVLDRLLFWRVDKRRSIEEMVGLGFDGGGCGAGGPDDRRRRIQATGAADREARAPDRRRGLPLSATPAGVGAGRMTGRDRPRRPAAPGVLYVVSTPIGNLGDVTLRALDVLRAVPLIAAEDTRHTKRLLDRYDIATRMTSYHARSGPARLGDAARSTCAAGRTSRSSPTPGRRVSATRAASWWRPGRGEGGRVVPIPGASAVLAAVVASGRRRAALGVRGVPAADWPRAARADRPDRGRRPRRRSSTRRPNRVAATLRDLAEACGADRPGRRLPGADEGPRVGRAGARWPTSRQPPDRAATSRRGVSSRSWSAARARRTTGARRTRPPSLAAAAAPRSRRWSRPGVARGDAARRVALDDGPATPPALRRRRPR